MTTHGGARNRSGPAADPRSGRSEARGLVFTALPREGYTDEPPTFPLAPITLFLEYNQGEGRDRTTVKEADDGETDFFRDREAAVWAEAWTTPQACAWATEPWRWSIVAEYCRLKTCVELAPSASASNIAQLHRYRDQLGLTPAGLRENGWAIASDEVGRKRSVPDRPADAAPTERRLRAAGGDGGA